MKPAETEQPPSPKMGLLGRINLFAQRLSRPARGAIAVAVFLVLLVLVVWGAFWLDPNNVPWRHSMSLQRILIILGLVMVLPVIVYQTIRLWLEGDVPRYADIDYAWTAGLAEMDAQGVSIESVPLFLIIGSAGDRFEKSLMDASEVEYRVRGVPKGSSALHWYADPRGIFLCLSTTCRLSALSALQTARESEESGVAPSTRQQVLTDEPLLSAQESIEIGHRLEYVCELLRRVRQPAVPCNGILAVLTLSALQLADSGVEEWERVIRADLKSLQRVLKVRCPVIGLVIGMENEPGFRELTRRVGSEHSGARFRRFGKGLDLTVRPTTEQLTSFAVHVTSVFEDWTYLLFRQPGALTRPGNRHLYALLCRVRLRFQSALTRLLAKGFGHRADASSGDDPILFGGCYFAATGETADRQAFVKGVIDKLYDEQESLEWTSDAIRESHRYGRMSRFVWTLNAVCGSTLGVMLIRRLFY